MRTTTTFALLCLLAACARDATPPAADAAAPPVAAPAPGPAPSSPPVELPSPVTRAPTFVGAWRAVAGSGVEVGTRYTFHEDGTLSIEAPSGTPATGAWTFVDGALTMTEDGIAYPTDIVAQDATHLHLRSRNPGGSVELRLER